MAKDPKKITGWAQALPDVGIVAITGTIGEGKSALAWTLADQAHQRGRAVAAFDFTEGARKALPRWVDHLETVDAVATFKPRRGHKLPAVLVMDEAALKANARRSMSTDNLEWVKLSAIARHKEILVLFISQNNRQGDSGIIMEAQTVLMKRPTELHTRFSRPELRQEVQEAFEGFAKASDKEGRKWTYVVDYRRGKRGWLRNTLPSWWSEKISRAFAAVDLAGAEAESTRRRQNTAMGAARRNGA